MQTSFLHLLVVALLLHLVVAQERDESERPVEYTIKIQLPVEYGVDEVFSHTIQTSRIKDNSKKETILSRFQELQSEVFNIKTQFAGINESMTTIDELIKQRGYLTKSSVPPIFDTTYSIGGYLNRLDQIQNFTIDLNHRVRDLEVRQTTNPREFLQQMAILFTDRIEIMKSDMFEQLQKLTKHEELLAEFYGELRTHSSVASTNEANIDFNQKMIEQLRQKVERLTSAWHQNISESRHNARTVRNSVPIKQSEGEQNELLSLPERLNKTIENEIYGNMTDLRGELMRQIAEAIEVFERDLKRTSEMIRDTIIKNDVSHRVEKLEKNQVYILDTDQIQELSLKQNFGDFPKRNVNSTNLKKLPEFSDEKLLKTDKSGECECDIPPAIGQAIIQQQLRMDLVLSEQSTMLLELKSRKEENKNLEIEVRKLKEERQQILNVVSEYQLEVKKLLEWKSRDEPMIEEHQRRLESQANSISSNAAVAHFTKHRLQKARFRCAGHGKKKGSFCFNLSKDARSWEAAEQRCKRQGGSLAVIKDEETMLFITNLIRGSSYDTSYWIGLSLDKETDRLNWVDNTTISENSFQNWYENLQPTRSERCIQSAGSLWDYKWYPSKCDRELRYICQV